LQQCRRDGSEQRVAEREEGLELVVCVQDGGGAMWWDSIGTVRS
jgi:hypothetical protein